MVKNLPANAGDVGSIPGSQEDPLKKEMATHFSVLAWDWGHKTVHGVTKESDTTK